MSVIWVIFKWQLLRCVYSRSLVAKVALPLEFQGEARRHVDGAVKLEAESFVGVAAGELRVGGSAGRRARAVRRAAVSFRLRRPRWEHRRVNCHWLFLRRKHTFVTLYTIE